MTPSTGEGAEEFVAAFWHVPERAGKGEVFVYGFLSGDEIGCTTLQTTLTIKKNKNLHMACWFKYLISKDD